MGATYAKLKLANSGDVSAARRGIMAPEQVRRMEVKVLVASGADDLIINGEIRAQLGLETDEEISVNLADGSVVKCERLEPVEIRFENRRTVVCPLMLPGGNEPLLGALPIEAMDVLIDLKNQKLMVNPAHPNSPMFHIR
ncbi:MAG: hypothetical protein LBP75_03310 [Planctomycetota bacterium]|jgi:clan AA aspartic protease|nr:hypothetical protein [Planctomycetota bacterium]